jgi:Na+-transporting methylmalonyl-CoA/oxaloacetate decarboxylase gamma subunit
MVMWPAVTLIGFLVLTALVIAMGISSTARYEAEKRAAAAPRTRSAAAEATLATAAATAVL